MAEKSGKAGNLKTGSRVQIDFQDSVGTATPKAKSSGPANKGDTGKAGKARSDKKATPKAEEFNFQQDLPETTTCLMDSEAAQILQSIQERMAVLSADPNLKIPVPFGDGLMYAKRRGIPSDAAVREILLPLKKKGVSDSEICKIANLKVESTDEVFALVPSLKDKKDKLREPLTRALGKLSKLNN